MLLANGGVAAGRRRVMRYRRSLLGVVASVCLASWDGTAADKTSLGCIQASDEAQTARDGGNLLRARELFAECAAPKCPALIRRDCTNWVEQVQQQIPSVVLGAHDAQGRDVLDARVTVDGQPMDKRVVGGPLELNPGSHVIRWESAGSEPVEMRIALRLEEKNRPVVATLSIAGTAPASSAAPTDSSVSPSPSERPLDSVAPRSGLPVSVYVLGGIGIAGLATFGYVGLRAKRDSDSLHDVCAPACAHADVQALKTKVLVADVALGIGLAGLTAATVIALTSRGAPPKTAWDVHVAPTVGGARAEALVRF
jgi:hypothetical protein